MNATIMPELAAAPTPEADGSRTLGEMRASFLAERGFDDGEVVYKAVEWIKVAPVPIPIPNPPSRVQALKVHDVHHMVTGYGTDLPSEWAISGWEVGAGLHTNPVAWTFCLMGHAAGMVLAPRRTLRAFARGRQGRTFFDQDADAVFALTLDEARAFCGTDSPPPPVTAGDVTRAIGWAMLGVVTSLVPPLAWAIARFGAAPEETLTIDDQGRGPPPGAADRSATKLASMTDSSSDQPPSSRATSPKRSSSRPRTAR